MQSAILIHFLLYQMNASAYFNRRSPRGKRHGTPMKVVTIEIISIHAPRMGSDVDPASEVKVTWISIHASHGKRHDKRFRFCSAKCISIHAPRMGSDDGGIRCRSQGMRFQSTLPARGATKDGKTNTNNQVISIHAPRMGSDGGAWQNRYRLPISIHAPREGNDLSRKFGII